MEKRKGYSREEYYRRIYRIRHFEESLLSLFSQNKLKGTTHPYIGQEATAVALMEHLHETDCLFSNHRCHGHFIEYTNRPELLLAEIMGKEGGVCRGRGGSQHLSYQNFYSNGIQGGFTPNATGMAFAEKYKRSGSIVVSFIGDGTLGQGVVYESMNMAALYSLPILYVIEDNGYAMTTSVQDAVAGSISQRVNGFGIETAEITSNDVEILSPAFKLAVETVRTQCKPFCQIIHTYRLGPHSKGDDVRDPEEVAAHRDQDPLRILGARIDKSSVQKIEAEVRAEMEFIIAECSEMQSEADSALCEEPISKCAAPPGLIHALPGKRCVTALNEGLRSIMQKDERTVILGEDIRDPYGGPFKITKGLSQEFPDRVINTPISEAGFIGLAIGMAMRGLRPIVDVMFGDFISLGFDQLLNHAAKYNWMYAGRVSVPVLIRVPMGGGRGYGATHSQTLEKHYIGIPGLRVLAVSLLLDPVKLLETINTNIQEPTLLIENKRMYAQRLYAVNDGSFQDFYVTATSDLYPSIKLSYDKNAVAGGVIITYGGYVDKALNVARRLMIEEEIMVDVIAVTQISPMDYEGLAGLIGSVPRIVTLEEGTRRAGWGAEVIAELSERAVGKQYMRIGALNCPLPVNDMLENIVIPSEDEIYTRIKGMGF